MLRPRPANRPEWFHRESAPLIQRPHVGPKCKVCTRKHVPSAPNAARYEPPPRSPCGVAGYGCRRMFLRPPRSPIYRIGTVPRIRPPLPSAVFRISDQRHMRWVALHPSPRRWHPKSPQESLIQSVQATPGYAPHKPAQPQRPHHR